MVNFFDKIQVYVLQAAALLRRCSTIDFFLKKETFFIFFNQLVFGTFPEKNLWWIFFIAKLQSENCRLITLLKETPPRSFPENFPNFCNQLFFLISPSVGKKKIVWKITWKPGVKPQKRNDSSDFCLSTL